MRASGSFLLDTNVVIALLSGDSHVRKKLASAVQAAVPLPAVGELYFGAFKSSRAAENLARLERMVPDWFVIECDRSTAREYGLIKNRLKVKGTPIPENDLWIAAIALQHDLVLVTRDDHFARVQDLKHTRW